MSKKVYENDVLHLVVLKRVGRKALKFYHMHTYIYLIM